MENIEQAWRKSSYSGNGGGNCVEVGNAARCVVVRDTKNREGFKLTVSPDAWRRLVADLRAGKAS